MKFISYGICLSYANMPFILTSWFHLSVSLKSLQSYGSMCASILFKCQLYSWNFTFTVLCIDILLLDKLKRTFAMETTQITVFKNLVRQMTSKAITIHLIYTVHISAVAVLDKPNVWFVDSLFACHGCIKHIFKDRPHAFCHISCIPVLNLVVKMSVNLSGLSFTLNPKIKSPGLSSHCARSSFGTATLILSYFHHRPSISGLPISSPQSDPRL